MSVLSDLHAVVKTFTAADDLLDLAPADGGGCSITHIDHGFVAMRSLSTKCRIEGLVEMTTINVGHLAEALKIFGKAGPETEVIDGGVVRLAGGRFKRTMPIIADAPPPPNPKNKWVPKTYFDLDDCGPLNTLLTVAHSEGYQIARVSAHPDHGIHVSAKGLTASMQVEYPEAVVEGGACQSIFSPDYFKTIVPKSGPCRFGFGEAQPIRCVSKLGAWDVTATLAPRVESG